MRKTSRQFLEDLLAHPSPSGSERIVQKIWCDYARKYADEVTTDAYGNAVAVLNPGASPKLMLDAHIDEIGMMIKYVDDKGFLYVQQIGGVDPALVVGKRVRIHTAKGDVLGIVGSTPIHLQDRSKERKVPKLHEYFIDIGAKDKKEALKRVSVGDSMTFTDQFEMLTDHIAVARGMDNRSGSWATIEALRLAKEAKATCAIYACSSVQEEVGLMGARMQVANVKPDAAIAVDVTFATDTPGIDMKQHGEIKLGQGPVVHVGRENHPALVERIRTTARKKKLAVQPDTFGARGGTDALAIFHYGGGIPSAVVSIPNRYMHSTIEAIDLRDLENTAKLLGAVAASLKKKDQFKVKL
jgi:endoglucanase